MIEDIISRIREAQIEATKEGIRANTVFISEKLAKSKSFELAFGTGLICRFPPMILGMDMRVTDDLPEEYDFTICEADETAREREKRLAAAEERRKIVDMLSKLIEKLEGEKL